MNTIGKNINILYRQFNLFLNHELSGIELNSTDLMYLGTLFIEDGVTQDDLAKDFCVDKAATARSMQNLGKKGIIIRKSDETDRRAKRIYLTDKAYKYKPLMESIQGKWMKISGFHALIKLILAKGVKNFVILAGENQNGLDEKLGYCGTDIMLFAQTLGLNTSSISRAGFNELAMVKTCGDRN